MKMDRRGFFKVVGPAAVGAAVLPTLAQERQPSARAPAAEPLKAHRWAMVVNLEACHREDDSREGGCQDCMRACHQIHNVPELPDPEDEVKWIWKESYEDVFPSQRHSYTEEKLQHRELPVFCNHCDNPPCARVCPTQATWKRDDGVVMMDWHRCIGCRYCIAACPYGSRSFNWCDPRAFIDELDPNFPSRTRGVVEKCNFCEERLASRQMPACVEVCPAKALVFGDLADEDSPVRELLSAQHSIRRRPELGTDPEIYYLV